MPCPTCGFDAAAWSRSDLQRTVHHAVLPWLGQLMEGARTDVVVALVDTASRLAELSEAEPTAELMHEAWRLLADAGRLRHGMGDGVAQQHGEVVQINTSDGGVPKRPVPTADIAMRGVAGDRQGNRKHHGRPWQAICLWSAEVVDALAAQGHPIGYGSAGENLTLRGLDWRSIRPGVRLLVGTALVETTPYAIPCVKNARWFSDGRFRRMAHEVAPGTSRIYARVLVDGVVSAGDPVVVEPMTVPVQRPTPQQTELAL